jgi:hypothetical protein
MKNSLSTNNQQIEYWSKHITTLALNDDLSSREIETYTKKLVEKASMGELGLVIKHLLNHIRTHK